jgi:release factor glutamine methyltransferase
MSKELLTRLSKVIGTGSARNELRWMITALESYRASKLPPCPPLSEMVDRRISGEPLQYILGTQPFGSLELLVRPPTLIPRPETEEWTLRLASLLRARLKPERPRMRILDMCTGTGCIPLLLLKELPPGSAEAVGVDVASEALALASENADHCFPPSDEHGSTVRPLVTFERANILSPQFVQSLGMHADRGFDVITSNPPYIPDSEYHNLETSVKNWEDPRALIGDPSDWPAHVKHDSDGETSVTGSTPEDHLGLTFYRAIAHIVARPGVLAPDCPLVLEVGQHQAEAVADILRSSSSPAIKAASTARRSSALPMISTFSKTESWTDPWGVQRVVIGWKTKEAA